MKLRGPAHVFNNMDDANNALLNHEIKAGEIVIIRYLGPKASYDSAYWFTSQLKGSDLYTNVAVLLTAASPVPLPVPAFSSPRLKQPLTAPWPPYATVTSLNMISTPEP